MRCAIKFSTRPTPDATLKTLWQIERDCPTLGDALRWAAVTCDKTRPDVLSLVHRVQIQVDELPARLPPTLTPA